MFSVAPKNVRRMNPTEASRGNVARDDRGRGDNEHRDQRRRPIHGLDAIEELSEKARQGRHTTTTAVLHRLPDGGELIDSPGVRDYAPFIRDTREVQGGFREIVARSADCRFDDCRHLAEPKCAIKTALAAGEIAGQRYESYKKLYEMTETFGSRRS